MNENETIYKVISVTPFDVVYECVKCGKRELEYCADPTWFYCRKCGRKIIRGFISENKEEHYLK